MTNAKIKKSYQPRFQTKKSRHLKTNYTKRRKMLRPNLKNYGAIKSRLVVRFTNSKVICQIIKAYTIGDKIVCSATSDELKDYGLKIGLTNYSAAYATGLLVARKALITNDLINNEERRPYQVFLDIGMKRSTKGSKCYAALKGAVDGGLLIPHNAERIFHHKEEDGEAKTDSDEYNSKTLHNRIHGKTVSDYMKYLKENNEEKFKKHFSKYLEQGLNADNLEQMYEGVFGKIREIKEMPVKKEKVKN